MMLHMQFKQSERKVWGCYSISGVCAWWWDQGI